MIVLDTSILVDYFSARPPVELATRVQANIFACVRMLIPSLVLYEWLRGPRTRAEITALNGVFPMEEAVVFGPREARISADIYRSVSRPRKREMDIAIAACAIARNASLWTMNTADFSDIPRLRLEPISRLH